MSNDVKMKWLSDSRAAQADMAKMEARMRKLEATAKRTNRETKKGAKESTTMFGSLTSKVGGFASGIGAANFAVQALNDSLTTTRELAEKAASARLKFGNSIRQSLINFVPDKSIGSSGELAERFKKASAATNTDQNLIASGFSGAASAKGSLSNEQALQAVITSAKLAPNDQKIISELPQRILDIQKMTPGANSDQVAGFFREMQSASRVTQLDKLGGTAPSALKALTKSGDTTEQAAELYATMTQLLADAEGDRSATAVVQLSQKLQAFKGFRGNPRAKSTADRLKLLQSNPALAQRFIRENNFEAKADAGVKSLVRGDKDAVAEYMQAQKVINSPTDKGQSKRFNDFVQGLEKAPHAARVRADNRSKQADQRLYTDDPAKAAAADARKHLNKVLDNSDIAWGPDFAVREATKGLLDADISVGKNPYDAAIDRIQNTIQGENALPSGIGWGPGTRNASLKGAEADYAKEQIDILKDLKAAAERQNALLDQQNKMRHANPNRNAHAE